MAMEYDKTPPAHDFDGVKTKVNRGYDISEDVMGYLIRIEDKNLDKRIRKVHEIRLRVNFMGEISVFGVK